jgi:hypothetical protein
MNQPEEAVEFVYYNNVWQFNHNRSFIEPIFFSGTNAAANAAASRTNLGLGATNDVIFDDVQATSFLVGDETNSQIVFEGNSAAITRTNLSLGATWLTNTSVTNFRTAIGLGTTSSPVFSALTLSAGDELQINGSGIYSGAFGGQLEFETRTLDQAGFNVFAWSTNSFAVTPPATFSTNVSIAGSLTATSTITAKTNMVVEGFVDFTTNRTNNSPTAGANFGDRSRWLQVKIGTNNFYIPLFQ